MSERPISVTFTSTSSEVTPKPAPKASAISPTLHYSYAPSKDGSDSNLLIFFHGLGDTDKPFFKLGQSLNLPQTAVLSVRGLKRIPLLEEDAFQYWDSFDSLGEIVSDPDPSKALKVVSDLLDHLISVCSWPSAAIHLFGFGQGGSLVAEALYRYKSRLGSAVVVTGPLLSLPTGKMSETPILLCSRKGGQQMKKAWFDKAFKEVTELKWAGSGGMPANQEEWLPVMKFWASNIRRLQPWEFTNSREEVYQVVQ